jgi:hypothetical protein
MMSLLDETVTERGGDGVPPPPAVSMGKITRVEKRAARVPLFLPGGKKREANFLCS